MSVCVCVCLCVWAVADTASFSSTTTNPQAAAFRRLYSAKEILFLPCGLVSPVRRPPAPAVLLLGRSIFRSLKIMLA